MTSSYEHHEHSKGDGFAFDATRNSDTPSEERFLVAHWGRMATAGSQQLKHFARTCDARGKALVMINEKTRKGYKEVFPVDGHKTMLLPPGNWTVGASVKDTVRRESEVSTRKLKPKAEKPAPDKSAGFREFAFDE